MAAQVLTNMLKVHASAILWQRVYTNGYTSTVELRTLIEHHHSLHLCFEQIESILSTLGNSMIPDRQAAGFNSIEILSLNGLDSLKPITVKTSKSNEKGTKRIIRSGGKEQDGGRIRLGKTGILVHRLIKESFRLHPVTPLLLPHEAMQECIVNGYHIPRKAQVTINVWATGRDPNVWKDAEEFIPERGVALDAARAIDGSACGDTIGAALIGSCRRACCQGTWT
ncbi:bifunctional dihydrocamalexate synthase/camalexin synthase-like [Rhododendron vialii]|uniref:bifunctional dihydrocamalexate synthase/camalexin synthase-like n=1 Tax=Rhododendron vialii TaxID=182163 RepID=UPI00265E24FD|nr:bifunctional dihydrocamalexate synthase/camalexin synthase-like [Rhododendron vialii]